MALTDELREWARNHRAELELGQLSERTIIDIANRIQTAATTDSLNARFNGYSSAIDEFCDKSMHLPVDADGEVIHLGDRVAGIPWEDGVVTGIQFEQVENGKVNASIAVRPHGWDTATWHDPEDYRHYRTPTVEDVLREFAERYLDYEGVPSAGRRGVGEELMDEYAARLRLVEESDTL